MVEKVRLSVGTAMRLGLVPSEDVSYFTTAFLLTYHPSGCNANCAFCPQAQDSTASSDRLSRLTWPEFSMDEVLASWPSHRGFARVCIQTLCYEEVVDDVLELTRRVRSVSDAPVSVAVHPVSLEDMERLKLGGVTDIGIALDACTREVFDQIKGESRGSRYRWEKHLKALKDALGIFGVGHVTTHLIVGLGETEKEAADFIFDMYGLGIGVGLFAFTPIKGTSLEGRPPPRIDVYRRIQTVRYLAQNEHLSREMVRTDKNGRISLDMDPKELKQILESGDAFRVSGCIGCNRPYYNERPSGKLYNYHRPLSSVEKTAALEEMELV